MILRRFIWNHRFIGFNFRKHRLDYWKDHLDVEDKNVKIAKDFLNPSVVDKLLGVRVNGVLRDLRHRVIDGDKVEGVFWNDTKLEGKDMFWHSR